MKEKELRERAKCHVCHKLIGQTGSPVFFVVTVQRYFVDLNAINRQSGLEAMLGQCAFVAQAMGPNEDMAKELESKVRTVCMACSMKDYCVAQLAEGE